MQTETQTEKKRFESPYTTEEELRRVIDKMKRASDVFY